jgi:hypothetical protein
MSILKLAKYFLILLIIMMIWFSWLFSGNQGNLIFILVAGLLIKVWLLYKVFSK